jgi:hypothetical protein
MSAVSKSGPRSGLSEMTARDPKRLLLRPIADLIPDSRPRPLLSALLTYLGRYQPMVDPQ